MTCQTCKYIREKVSTALDGSEVVSYVCERFPRWEPITDVGWHWCGEHRINPKLVLRVTEGNKPLGTE